MAVKSMYNSFTNQYSLADSFGAISESHQCALNQINHIIPDIHSNYKVLDLGVGDGAFLKKLKQNFPHIQCTGIDTSQEMLKRAKQSLSFTSIESSAADASKYLPLNSQDLVLEHFINSYIPINTLFEQARLLLSANGHFSMITSTYESFPVAQQYLANFIAKDTLMSSFVGHYYKSVVKNTTVASGEEELLAALKKHQLHVVDHQRLHIPIQFNNIEELSLFGIDGAWFLNALAISMLPKNFLLQRIKQIFNKIFTFPYQDTHVIDVLLVKK